MQFETQNVDGSKSVDRKIAKLLKSVNEHIGDVAKGDPREADVLQWARAAIEGGVKSIARHVFAHRIS